MEASVTFKAVGKAIGKKTLIADLSFGVEKGSTFVLIGKNGAGKSTILKLLVGLIEKDTGSEYIQGQDISTRSAETRLICGYMPQTINLDEGSFAHVKFQGLHQSNIIGSPELPEIHKLIEIPQGARPRVEIVSEEVAYYN